MNESLKTRLVGAGVMLIAAGLLWPLLFDFDESMQPSGQQSLALEIPDARAAHAQASASSTFAQRKTVAAEANDSKPAKPEDTKATLATAAASEPAPEKDRPVAVAKKTIVEKTSQKSSAKPSVPTLDSQGIPVAWVIQVGTFGRWENADKLRVKLIEHELRAFVDPATSKQNGPYRVQVGPLLTYDEARDANQKIREDYELRDTFIRRFKRGAQG